MGTQTSSIDDILFNATQPNNTTTPKVVDEELDEIRNDADVNDDVSTESEEDGSGDFEGYDEASDDDDDEREAKESKEVSRDEPDEYGNEENASVRKRLGKMAQKHQSEKAELEAQIAELRGQVQGLSASQKAALNKAVDNFEHDPSETGDWKEQLAAFVEDTVGNMSRKNEESKIRAEEAAIQSQFESRFQEDVSRFSDFEKTIREVPAQIDDIMIYSTRSMKNPASFLYAAAKRAPLELQRIANIRDPYAKIAAMGALEASLRQGKGTTKAPRPVTRIQGETTKTPKKVNPQDPNSPGYIENLIARTDTKRKAQIAARRR